MHNDDNKQNIGIFDSGLGGLLILKHIRGLMPEYNYVFYADQIHVPYGQKTVEELLVYSKEVLHFLYKEKNCKYVLLACNTTSATIFDELKAWVSTYFPDRKVFGIVRPTVLSLKEVTDIVVFGTHRTIESHEYKKQIRFNFENIKEENITEIQLKNLASLIENGQETFSYLQDFNYQVPANANTAILGCTHYGIVLSDFKSAFPQIKNWILQEEIIPQFFKSYLDTKTDERNSLATDGSLEIYVSKENLTFNRWKDKWFGEDQAINVVK